MYLEADDAWRMSAPIFAAFDNPSLHKYSMVKLALNTEVFFVDLTLECKEEEPYSLTERFICCSIDQALAILKTQGAQTARLAILVPRGENHNEYIVQDVKEIYRVMDNSDTDNKGILYRFINGGEYINYNLYEIHDYKLIECLFSIA